MRILIVEDDAALRESIAAALEAEGHTALQAIDGLDAWQELHEDAELPDVIVLDLRMPRMNGETFRARQLAKPRLAGIPTIVLTVELVEPQLRASIGAIPVFPKSHPLAELLAAIHEVSEPPSPVKRCACGRTYDAASWASLPSIGEIDNGRGVGERMELRHCVCGSTIAREVGRHARSWRPGA